MEMYPTALWILDVWVLTGVAIGLLATIYGAFRSQWHILAGIVEFLDWFFFCGVGSRLFGDFILDPMGHV